MASQHTSKQLPQPGPVSPHLTTLTWLKLVTVQLHTGSAQHMCRYNVPAVCRCAHGMHCRMSEAIDCPHAVANGSDKSPESVGKMLPVVGRHCLCHLCLMRCETHLVCKVIKGEATPDQHTMLPILRKHLGDTSMGVCRVGRRDGDM